MGERKQIGELYKVAVISNTTVPLFDKEQARYMAILYPGLQLDYRPMDMDKRALAGLHDYDVVCVNVADGEMRSGSTRHHAFSQALRASGFKGKIAQLASWRYNEAEDNAKRAALFDGAIHATRNMGERPDPGRESDIGDLLTALGREHAAERGKASDCPRIGVLSRNVDKALRETEVLRHEISASRLPGIVTPSCTQGEALNKEVLNRQDVMLVCPSDVEDRGSVFFRWTEQELRALHKHGYQGKVVYMQIAGYDQQSPAFAAVQAQEKAWIAQMKEEGLLHETIPYWHTQDQREQALTMLREHAGEKKRVQALLPEYLKKWNMAAKAEVLDAREPDWPQRLQVDFKALGERVVSGMTVLREEATDYAKFKTRLEQLWEAAVKDALEAKGRWDAKTRASRKMTEAERLEGLQVKPATQVPYKAWYELCTKPLYDKVLNWHSAAHEQKFPYAQRAEAGQLLDFGRALKEAGQDVAKGEHATLEGYKAALLDAYATRICTMLAEVKRLPKGAKAKMHTAVVEALQGRGALPIRVEPTKDEAELRATELAEQQGNEGRITPGAWTQRGVEALKLRDSRPPSKFRDL